MKQEHLEWLKYNDLFGQSKKLLYLCTLIIKNNMSNHSSTRAVLFALIGNLFISIIKFGAAFLTTSTAMLAEAVH